jgi:hypothetical protein
LLVGCELSLFLAGILPGEGLMERLALMADPVQLMAAVAASGVDPRERIGSFLSEAVRLARSRFAGPLSYASGPWEDVDWSQFDFIGMDAYRDTGNRADYAGSLRAYAGHGLPLVITEFGCATYRGAADRGSLAWTVVDRSVSPGRLPPGIVRDEEGQARELTDVLRILEAESLHGAFVYTLVASNYPSNDDDPALDLDAASYALLRSWPDGRLEPKAAFHAVSDYYAAAS